MSRHLYIRSILKPIIAISMIVAVVGIPLVFAMHTHSDVEDRYGIHRVDQDGSVAAQHCGLCVFYAHYTPKEFDFNPSFTIAIPEFRLYKQLEQHQYGIPGKALCRRHTNKGPPSVHTRI